MTDYYLEQQQKNHERREQEKQDEFQGRINDFVASEQGKIFETEWNNTSNFLEERHKKRRSEYDEAFNNRYAQAQEEGETAEQLKERVDRKARQDEALLKSHQEDIETRKKNKQIEIGKVVENIEFQRQQKKKEEQAKLYNDAYIKKENKQIRDKEYQKLVNGRNGGRNKRVNTKKHKSKPNNTKKEKSKNRKTKRRTNK